MSQDAVESGTTETADTLMRRIRDLINAPRAQEVLFQDRPRWLQLTSSLDAIEDCELAIEAYEARAADEHDSGREDGGHAGDIYLAVYGLLQALFLQQDALRDMCGSLRVELQLKDFPRLQEIKELRNDSVGHPTNRRGRKGQPASYHMLSRHSLTYEGFNLLSSYEDETSQFRYVVIQEVIDDQRRFAAVIMSRAADELQKRAADHRKTFRSTKVADAFHPSIGYMAGKVIEATSPEGSLEAGAAALEQLKEALVKFRTALGERDISVDSYPGIAHAYQKLERPLRQLARFLDESSRGEEPRPDREDAYIFAWFVRQQFEELKDMAAEIDEEYAKED